MVLMALNKHELQDIRLGLLLAMCDAKERAAIYRGGDTKQIRAYAEVLEADWQRLHAFYVRVLGELGNV